MKLNLFSEAIELLSKYRKDPSLTNEQGHIISEVISRLKNVSEKYVKIVESNAKLLSEDTKLKKLREAASTENINKIMREQAKKDPELAKYLSSIGGKLELQSMSEISAYNMSDLSEQPHQKSQQIKSLHSDTESVYHNLWAINLRLNQLLKFKNFKPAGVRDVRNHLIEHTDNLKSSGASIFSFGVVTNGPVLRPIKPVGVKAPNDAGLEANVEEFLSTIIRVLS